MLKTHRRSVFVAIALIILAIGAFFMANVELPRGSYVISSINVLLFALPAFAHHSGAMFDNQKSTSLTGTVKIFQWSSPHCWIQLLVPGGTGFAEWSVEMGSPSQLFHGGWKPKSLKFGDTVTVVLHPMRDGTNAGLFVSAMFSDGRAIGTAP